MSKLYEIVELSNGDIALQNDDLENGESLIVMKFSDELKNVLQDAKIDLAKVMVESGLEFVAKLAEERAKIVAEIENSDANLERIGKIGADSDVEALTKTSKESIQKNDKIIEKKQAGKFSNQNADKNNKSSEELEEEMVSHLVH
ncbi:MAG: hypothetical protein K6L75_06085 [Cellvibrionaceae bacterium]